MILNYKAGDVISYDPGEAIGHEMGKPRPAVILSVPYNYSNNLNLAIIVPISRTAKPWWFVVQLKKDDQNKLSTDSFVHCHHIRSISFERIIKKIGNTNDKTLEIIRGIVNRLINGKNF